MVCIGVSTKIIQDHSPTCVGIQALQTVSDNSVRIQRKNAFLSKAEGSGKSTQIEIQYVYVLF